MLLINIHNDVILRKAARKMVVPCVAGGSIIAMIADYLAAYLIILSTVQSLVATVMVIIVTTYFDWYYCVGQAWLQLAQPLMFLISSQDFHQGNCLGCLYYSYATVLGLPN